jgi:hypothetical protein
VVNFIEDAIEKELKKKRRFQKSLSIEQEAELHTVIFNIVQDIVDYLRK